MIFPTTRTGRDGVLPHTDPLNGARALSSPIANKKCLIYGMASQAAIGLSRVPLISLDLISIALV